MTPLARACKALRLPPALYCDRGDLPRPDAEIRRALRAQHVGAERLTLALADVIALGVTSSREGIALHGDDITEPGDVWRDAAAVVKARDLPASLIGVLAVLAILPEEGALDPDEIGLWVEAAP